MRISKKACIVAVSASLFLSPSVLAAKAESNSLESKTAAGAKSADSKPAQPAPVNAVSAQAAKSKHVPAQTSGERGLGEFAAVNRFAFKLLGATDKSSKNAFLSPISAYLAMSMVLDGATGKTADEIARALQLTARDRAQLDQRNKQLTASITKMKDVQIANALFADASSPFLPSYLQINKQIYNSRVENISFSADGSVKKVNDWCLEKTHGKIPEIIKIIPQNTKLLLLNATYFKGTWARQFNKSLTEDRPFTALDGVKITVPMMRLNDKLKYVQSPAFEMLRIPYAASKLSMFIMLPAKNQDFGKFASSLSADTFDNAVRHMKSTDVVLSLPKFKVESSFSLKRQLSSLGLSDAFKADAGGFTKMTKTAVCIDEILQKTLLDVNEEGTTAAGVTVAEMGSKDIFGAAPTAPVNFIVDRPFVAALKDESTGSLLFLGSIIKPRD